MGALIGVPPGASVIISDPTAIEIVFVGIMRLEVVPAQTKVSAVAVGFGNGFGSTMNASEAGR